jgi:tubulin-like protein
MNHLIIGLGGTGGNVICALRKNILREYPDGKGEPRKKLENGELSEPEARIGYLYVDSDIDAVKASDEWRLLGESVRLDQTQRLFLDKAQLGANLESVNQNRAISRWLGNLDKLRRLLRDTDQTPGAGQIRRRGRILFAKAVDHFMSQGGPAVVQQINRLERGNMVGVTIHICCTLAGGTGSGSVVDAVTQIRKSYRNAAAYPINLYVLVTDQPCDAALGNFYANQYAALVELNALVRGDYQPHDIAAHGDRVQSLTDAFQLCYLVSEINQAGRRLSKPEQEQLIADYLFTRVFAPGTLQESGFHYSWTMQDLANRPGDEKRSYRFGALGVKRWAIPVTEIREKLAFSFARSAVLRMLYQHWRDETGYADTPQHLDIPKEVAAAATSEDYDLSEDQVLLRTGFDLRKRTTDTPRWEDEWNNIVTNAVLTLQQERTVDWPLWLETLWDQTHRHFASGFRERGVDRYYRERIDAVAEYARQFRDALEADLFERWRTGSHFGTDDIGRFIDRLRDELDKRARGVSSEREEWKKTMEATEKGLAEYRRKWPRIGWLLNALTGKRRRTLATFRALLNQYWTQRTHHAALEFKNRVLEKAVRELDDLRGTVSTINQQLKGIANDLAAEKDVLCVESSRGDGSASLWREYVPAEINRTIDLLTSDRPAQNEHVEEVLGRLDAMVDLQRTFTGFKEHGLGSKLRDMIEQISFRSSERHHDLQRDKHGYDPMLNVSIVEILQQKYDGKPEMLVRKVEEFMSAAATALEIAGDQDQPRRIEEDDTVPLMPQRRIAVFLPDAGRPGDSFIAHLTEAFQHAVQKVNQVVVVESPRRHEIVVLSADYWMALRFAQPLGELRKKYNDKLSATRGDAMSELHIEDFEQPLADLFLPKTTETGKQGRMLLYLGEHLGCLAEQELDGRKPVVFFQKGASGQLLAPPEIVAERRSEFDTLGLKRLANVEESLRSVLGVRNKAEPGFRQKLLEEIDGDLERCWRERGGNDAANADPEYQRRLEIARAAQEFVKSVLR